VLVDSKYGEALLVVVGAGASYDSIDARHADTATERPPLTKDLASPTQTAIELIAKYGSVRPLIAELRSSLAIKPATAHDERTTTLEDALREYLSRRFHDGNVRSHIPNGCFGRVLIIGWRAAETHFLPLLTRLVSEDARIQIVTGGTTPALAQADADLVMQILRTVVEYRRINFQSSIEGFCGFEAGSDLEWLLG
jgi:hypothetical protein